MNYCKYAFMDMEAAVIAAKEYQERAEFLSREFFNLPAGWVSTYHTHYQKAKFSLFDARREGNPGFTVELKNGKPVVIGFDRVTKVDWYIISQYFGGADVAF